MYDASLLFILLGFLVVLATVTAVLYSLSRRNQWIKSAASDVDPVDLFSAGSIWIKRSRALNQHARSQELSIPYEGRFAFSSGAGVRSTLRRSQN